MLEVVGARRGEREREKNGKRKAGNERGRKLDGKVGWK